MPDGLVLGFDFGLKRIGVAVGQTVTKTAKPLITLAAEQGQPEWAALKKLFDRWQPTALVVGLPLNMDDSEQPITQSARHFAVQLQQHFSLPVFLVDERLSTKEARAQLFAKHGFKGLQAAAVDSIAAAVILEQWLAEDKKTALRRCD